jgi:LSD1 subclass zinc finger protein
MSTDSTRFYPCNSCGAKLEFSPGQRSLKCPFCGAENAIAEASTEEKAKAEEKLDFIAYLREQSGNEPTLERQTVKCPGCGAQSQLPPNVTADRCAFCAAPLVAGSAYALRTIQPRAIAPFEIKEGDARQRFKQWLEGLWFAPNALKQAARAESGLKGIYIPYWTYDSNSQTPYMGERGEIYFEVERYYENGEEKTREVERIRWWPVSGNVSVRFNDVTVPASQSVPKNYADGLAPWDYGRLQPYRDDYVSGFTVEAYQIGLEPGFNLAQQNMEVVIRDAICRDIGGAQQRILSMSPYYFDISFKHILLPIWMSSYRYADKTYRFLVNGQTGTVQGERPYSVWKIAGAVTAAVAVIVLVLKLTHHL